MSEEGSQFEQENDLGAGGGEVEDETMGDAWETAEDRRSTADDYGDPANDSPDGAEAAA